MPKHFLALASLSLAILSLIAFLYLSDAITSGSQKVAEGQQQLQLGEQQLAAGKAKLAHGQQMLAPVNTMKNTMGSLPIVGIVAAIPVSAVVFGEAKTQIAAGNDLIAKGQAKVKSGEGRLQEGKLQLSRGKERLNQAKLLRMGCGLGCLGFAGLGVFALYRKKFLR